MRPVFSTEVPTVTARNRGDRASSSAMGFSRMLLVALVASMSVYAQDASINGTITDPSGAVVPGAKVVISRPGCSCSRDCPNDQYCKCCADQLVSSDGSGSFTVRVPAGQYKISVQATGFKTASLEVSVESGDQKQVKITLDTGAAPRRN